MTSKPWDREGVKALLAGRRFMWIGGLAATESDALNSEYRRELDAIADALIAREAELRAEIEGLRRDKARLDWLCDPSKCYWVQVQSQPAGKYVFSGAAVRGLRAAIDAAMKGEG